MQRWIESFGVKWDRPCLRTEDGQTGPSRFANNEGFHQQAPGRTGRRSRQHHAGEDACPWPDKARRQNRPDGEERTVGGRGIQRGPGHLGKASG
jgi:hypothetical protein